MKRVAEVENIVAGDDHDVVVDMKGVDGVLYVSDGAEAGLIGRGAVVNDSDGLTLTFCPSGEMGGEFVIGDDNEAINVVAGADVIYEPVEYGLAINLEQWFRKIFCQGVQSCCIACC